MRLLLIGSHPPNGKITKGCLDVAHDISRHLVPCIPQHVTTHTWKMLAMLPFPPTARDESIAETGSHTSLFSGASLTSHCK
ncbi:hypothetical protein DM02DRAFT_607845 [Periconia macrospinosa]|uniref:Uncharacterized protein n=1 Tax=Periconia macrospinosa TaxID=97972 RepID=A0A2V1EDM1_9PLEO|nr:hypothetical protein DM02DRAFT_607845 [Periconia macrospinosa]